MKKNNILLRRIYNRRPLGYIQYVPLNDKNIYNFKYKNTRNSTFIKNEEVSLHAVIVISYHICLLYTSDAADE